MKREREIALLRVSSILSKMPRIHTDTHTHHPAHLNSVFFPFRKREYFAIDKIGTHSQWQSVKDGSDTQVEHMLIVSVRFESMVAGVFFMVNFILLEFFHRNKCQQMKTILEHFIGFYFWRESSYRIILTESLEMIHWNDAAFEWCSSFTWTMLNCQCVHCLCRCSPIIRVRTVQIQLIV